MVLLQCSTLCRTSNRVFADLAVHSDAQLLERVLRNLVSNAVRDTTTGGVMLQADLLGSNLRGGSLRLRVAASGLGLLHKPVSEAALRLAIGRALGEHPPGG